MTKKEFMEMLAAMDDEEFESFAKDVGFTRRPDEHGRETISDFRCKVVESLRREKVSEVNPNLTTKQTTTYLFASESPMSAVFVAPGYDAAATAIVLDKDLWHRMHNPKYLSVTYEPCDKNGRPLYG